MRNTHLLALIILISGIIRLISFGQIPYGVNRDEAALGYNAYSLQKTGKDEHGVFMPFQLRSFGDWKKPVYSYLSIIPISLFGLSVETTRIVGLVFSLILIWYTAKVVDWVTKDIKSMSSASVWVALFLCLNPWHFFLSRTASETVVATAFFMGGVFYFLTKKYWLGTVFFILSLFTYHALLILVPLWLGIYALVHRRNILKPPLIIHYLVLGLCLTFLFHATFFTAEKDKATGLVIFDLSQAQKQSLMDQRTEWYSKFIHNRYVFIATTFIKNYARSFSPEFLFLKGGSNQSYNVNGFGYFYPIEIIAAIIGVYFLVTKQKKIRWEIVALLFITPIPAALTFEAVHATRQFAYSVSMAIFASLGISWFLSKSKHRVPATAVIVILLILSAEPFFKYYFGSYAKESDNIYHGYMKSISQNIKKEKDSEKYQNINVAYFRESPYIFYAFYNQLDPRIFHESIEYYPPDFEGFVHVKKLDGVWFVERDEEAIALKEVIRENNLNFSRPDSLEYWIKPLSVWDNLQGEREIVSWQENQI